MQTTTAENHTEQRQSELLDHEAVNIRQTRRMPVKVPMSAVRLTLNPDSLGQLPAGAGYTAHQGQAHIKVSRRPPTSQAPEQIVIEAGCDSLELVCAEYAQTVSVLKKRIARQQQFSISLCQEIKKTSGLSGIRTILKWFIIGLVAGLILSKIKRIISFVKGLKYGN